VSLHPATSTEQRRTQRIWGPETTEKKKHPSLPQKGKALKKGEQKKREKRKRIFQPPEPYSKKRMELMGTSFRKGKTRKGCWQGSKQTFWYGGSKERDA